MPAGGRFRFTFIGEQPLIFRIVAILTVANPFIGLALPFAVKHLGTGSSRGVTCRALESSGVQFQVPGIICWYAEWWIGIEFALLACIAVLLVFYRKRVRFERTGD
jgi:hypothetical protein